MTAVLVDIQLHSVMATKTDIVKDGMTHQRTIDVSSVTSDLGILSTVARYNEVHVGVYASVERGGTIHRGDTI